MIRSSGEKRERKSKSRLGGQQMKYLTVLDKYACESLTIDVAG